MPEHHLKRKGIQKLCAFYDGQMDEIGLGTWVAEQAMASGAKLLENCEVSKINTYDGSVVHNHGREQYDLIRHSSPLESQKFIYFPCHNFAIN